MEYEIREGRKCKRFWTDIRCHPTPAQVESMYSVGLKMYVDGKALKKSEAVEICRGKK